MVARMGDDIFRLGKVGEDEYLDLVSHPTVRALAAASCLEGLPSCTDCAYNCYCGVCPIYNYVRQGDLYGQMPANERCRVAKGTMDLLFSHLDAGGDEMRALLTRWTLEKTRAPLPG